MIPKDSWKINKDGVLEVVRVGEFRVMTCPYQNKPCGDWCACFGEPHKWVSNNNMPQLETCTGLHNLSGLIDERGE